MPWGDTRPYVETLLVDTGLQWVETGGAKNPYNAQEVPHKNTFTMTTVPWRNPG